MLTAEQQALAEEYVAMAENQAWDFAVKTGGRMSVDDARSAALLGLVQAIGAYPGYCEKHGYDAEAGHRTGWLRAYVLRRIRGAILDQARSTDHLTRSDRKHVKVVRQAEDDGIRDEAGKAAAAGVTVATVRRLEADALITVSLQDQSALDGADYSAGPAVTDHGAEADVEGQAVVSDIISAFMASFDRLPAIQQVLLAFVFHRELDITVAARAVYLKPDEARRQLEEALCAVHRALLLAVSA